VDNQKNISKEAGIRLSWRPIKALRNQTEIRLKNQFRENKASISRNRDIISYFLNQRLSWRFKSRWESGFEAELASEENRLESYPLKLWYAVLKAKLAYALPGLGRISSDYQYQSVNVTSNPQNHVVPYEMAKGKKKGASQNWQLRAEYTLMKNIVFTFFYSGRDDAGFDRVIHSGQAEIRAFF